MIGTGLQMDVFEFLYSAANRGMPGRKKRIDRMNVKELDSSSFREIVEMFKAVFSAPPWNEEWKDDQVNEYIHDLIDVRGSLLFGLYESEKLIGFSIGKIKHWCGGTEYFIEELCIRHDFQGRGFGRKFFELIKNRLKEREITQIFLMTDRDKPAYEFYRKIGFIELPEITSFFMEF